MTITAQSGPVIEYGTIVGSTGNVAEYNENRAPSLTDLGNGMLDPRSQYNYGYNPGMDKGFAGNPIMGFWGQTGIVDYIPSAISSNNIAAAQVPSAGTALTLASVSSANGTYATNITAPETGKTVNSVFTIDLPCGGSSQQGVPFGQTGSVQIWNPASVGGRCITITGSSQNDGGMYWSVAGRDVYGFKVTEQIQGSTGGSTSANAYGVPVTSKKAYKYITGITPVNSTGTIASTNVVVGTADTYGFPMLVQHPAYIQIWLGQPSSATFITANAGNHTFGSTLATATSTNGDVRGTYASTIASNGTTMRVLMIASPTVVNLSTEGTNPGGVTYTTYPGIFGATQFSSV